MGKFAKVLVGLRSRLGRVGLMRGVATAIEHKHLLKRKWDVIVDIGANRGQFALATQLYCPSAKVICFEPLAAPCALLSEIFGNLVTIHAVAIGAKSSWAMMHVAARDDSSSLLPIGNKQVAIFPGTQEVRQEWVKVIRLCEAVSPLEVYGQALLKIDVQGYELEALKGCEEMLDLFSAINVECSTLELYKGQSQLAEVIFWLQKHGFNIHETIHGYYNKSGYLIQGDFLFERATVTRDHNTGGALPAMNLKSPRVS